MNLLLRIAATAVAVWVAALLVPGISVGATGATENASANLILTFVVVAVIIGVVNAIVKPIAEALSGCFILLTLGLFILVINAAMLKLSAWLAGQAGIPFIVDSWSAAFFGSIIVSIVSALINGLTGVNRDKKSRK